MPEKIKAFTGPNRFLSNFWPAQITYDGLVYPTVEHAYQAAKSLNLDVRKAVQVIPKPEIAKRYGRDIHKRPGWESIKIDVMHELLDLKFAIPELREKLLATGDAVLEEGNWWNDRYWGMYNGQGHNHLGKLLMQVRSQIQTELNSYAQASP